MNGALPIDTITSHPRFNAEWRTCKRQAEKRLFEILNQLIDEGMVSPLSYYDGTRELTTYAITGKGLDSLDEVGL